MGNREVYLAEYSALREEITNTGQNQHNMFVFAFTAIGAISAFALQQRNPYIILFAFVVLLAASKLFHNYSLKFIQVSAYIKVYLESELEGLNWESEVSKWRKNATYPPVDLKNYLFTIGAFALFTIYLFLLRSSDYECLHFVIRVLVPLPLMGVVVSLDNKHKNQNLRKCHDNFEEYWKKLKDDRKLNYQTLEE